MTTLIIDIETNAITDWRELTDLKEIHCLVVREGDEVRRYNSQENNIEEGLREMAEADVIVGHNAQAFDIPAILKLYPDFKMRGVIRDTMILARLVHPDIRDEDYKRGEDFPRNLIGAHSLKSWGYRLGEYKGDFGDTTDWSCWTQEMEDYCVQDTRVTYRLYTDLMREQPSEQSIKLEHDFAYILKQQERHGFRFDTDTARNLHAELLDRKAELEREMQEIFPPTEIPMKTPAYYIGHDGPDDSTKFATKTAAKKAGYKDSQITKGPRRVKVIPFNPGSRDQIAKCLQDKYQWKPKEYTSNGKPKIDESILTSMSYDEAKPLVDYLTVCKRLGQLAEGKEAWLKSVDNDRLYGRVNTNGTVTGRCTHSRPNLSQVPSISSPYGLECRSLFLPDDGHVLVGADASGLELRMLAHYLAYFDGGKYAKEVCEGDIHTTNQKAAGLPTRNDAKTFIYAFLYGAGDQKLGSIVTGGVPEGRKLRERFLNKIPAIKQLKNLINKQVDSRGYLKGLDGRHLPIRSKHSALNLALQSAGAVVMKEATVILNDYLFNKLPEGVVYQVAHIHDEIQLSVKEDYADEVGRFATRSITEAGENLNLQCPLSGEYKVGRNWAETH
tara:strand:- start:1739 stop:3577 length:1839 start_codon:yes stop_codon:yes gene_type:complete